MLKIYVIQSNPSMNVDDAAWIKVSGRSRQGGRGSGVVVNSGSTVHLSSQMYVHTVSVVVLGCLYTHSECGCARLLIASIHTVSVVVLGCL